MYILYFRSVLNRLWKSKNNDMEVTVNSRNRKIMREILLKHLQ